MAVLFGNLNLIFLPSQNEEVEFFCSADSVLQWLCIPFIYVWYTVLGNLQHGEIMEPPGADKRKQKWNNNDDEGKARKEWK